LEQSAGMSFGVPSFSPESRLADGHQPASDKQVSIQNWNKTGWQQPSNINSVYGRVPNQQKPWKPVNQTNKNAKEIQAICQNIIISWLLEARANETHR